ncbi:hypothetical protein J6590_020314 [Homalodisca vitripennis]|nr:hypothetical protein J6590_020314 [Homalodisca vitripennis]
MGPRGLVEHIYISPDLRIIVTCVNVFWSYLVSNIGTTTGPVPVSPCITPLPPHPFSPRSDFCTCEPRATASTGSSWRSLRRSRRRDRSSALLSAHASLAPPPRQARAGGHSADHVAVTALRRYFLHMRASRHRLDRLELEVTPQITSP